MPLTWPAAKVPNYTARACGDLGGEHGIVRVQLKDRPINEAELSARFVSCIGQLVDIVFDPTLSVLDPAVVSQLVSTAWGAPEDVGSGTTDMSMRRPQTVSEAQWALFRNFVGEFKLLAEDVSVCRVSS